MPVRIRYSLSKPPKQTISTTLSENSWDTISAVAEAHQASKYWSVGDEIDISLGTYGTYTFQIYGFDIDDKADGSGKAGITFGMKDVLNESMYMNGKVTAGWGTSEMRNEYVPTYYDAMPNDLKSVIKLVNKKTAKAVLPGYDVGYTLDTTEDKLFLFAEKEVGFHNFSDSIEYDALSAYPIFDNPKNRKKTMNRVGYVVSWWLRSPIYYGTDFIFIDTNGYSSYDSRNALNGVCFGFCV